MKKKKSDLEYCERDYKNNHYWESIGVMYVSPFKQLEIFKCTQCQKCKAERLEFVKGGGL